MANHQRVGSISNAHAGRDFTKRVAQYLSSQGLDLAPEYPVAIGRKVKTNHKFDLGSGQILVECKSYTWTVSENIPSAKIRGLNEAMLLFSVAPDGFRKMLFMLKHQRRGESLGAYYVRTQGHLIGEDVEIWDFDPDSQQAERLI